MIGRELDDGRKVLVIGASGLVGRALVGVGRSLGHTVVGTFNSNPADGLVRMSLTDTTGLMALLESLSPDVIMVPGAVTNVDWAESHKDDTFACNTAPIQTIGSYARSRGSLVVFFSTDYVFDGRDGPYSEEAEKRPLSVYGWSKAVAEDILQESHARSLIVRTTWVYGSEPRGKNFVCRLLRSLEGGQSILVPTDQFGSPTHALDLARKTWLLSDGGFMETFNVAGPQVMDRWSFAAMCASEFNFDPRSIVGVRTEELGQEARRPLKGGLLVHKLVKATGRLPQDVGRGLREMVNQPILIQEGGNLRGSSR